MNENKIPRNIASLIKRAILNVLSFMISPSFFSKLAFKYGLATVIIKKDGTIEPTGRIVDVKRPDN